MDTTSAPILLIGVALATLITVCNFEPEPGLLEPAPAGEYHRIELGHETLAYRIEGGEPELDLRVRVRNRRDLDPVGHALLRLCAVGGCPEWLVTDGESADSFHDVIWLQRSRVSTGPDRRVLEVRARADAPWWLLLGVLEDFVQRRSWLQIRVWVDDRRLEVTPEYVFVRANAYPEPPAIFEVTSAGLRSNLSDWRAYECPFSYEWSRHKLWFWKVCARPETDAYQTLPLILRAGLREWRVPHSTEWKRLRIRTWIAAAISRECHSKPVMKASGRPRGRLAIFRRTIRITIVLGSRPGRI